MAPSPPAANPAGSPHRPAAREATRTAAEWEWGQVAARQAAAGVVLPLIKQIARSTIAIARALYDRSVAMFTSMFLRSAGAQLRCAPGMRRGPSATFRRLPSPPRWWALRSS